MRRISESNAKLSDIKGKEHQISDGLQSAQKWRKQLSPFYAIRFIIIFIKWVNENSVVKVNKKALTKTMLQKIVAIFIAGELEDIRT